jgi:hypothetical protein
MAGYEPLALVNEFPDLLAVAVESINGPELLSGYNRKISSPAVSLSLRTFKVDIQRLWSTTTTSMCPGGWLTNNHATSLNNLELAYSTN